MQTSKFTLPAWSFVGGESQKRGFTVSDEDKRIFNLPDAKTSLAIIEFENPYGTPILTKTFDIAEGDDGKYSEVVLSLSPSDTVGLSGKYIYQITIKDVSGNVSIPSQGIMSITTNIDKSFIS